MSVLAEKDIGVKELAAEETTLSLKAKEETQRHFDKLCSPVFFIFSFFYYFTAERI